MTRSSADGGEPHLKEEEAAALSALAAGLKTPKTVALIGLMGAGKTTVGRRLAAALDLPFRDADSEIEKAAGLSIPEIFELHGEADFRGGERRVIKRLISCEAPHVLATGGGAYMDPETRAVLREHAITVWLKADLDVLTKRVGRRETRPLLQNGDPRAVMERLMAERYPIYAEADITVESAHGPHTNATAAVIAALKEHLNA